MRQLSTIALRFVACVTIELMSASAAAQVLPQAGAEPTSAAHATAESGQRFCFDASPAPTCRSFAVTTWGVSFGVRPAATVPETSNIFIVPPDRQTHGTSRVISDFGVMWNVGGSDAVGVSWFITADEVARTGPTVRYRRWLAGTRSLDVAIGVPVAVSQGYGDMTISPGGTVLGLVRYDIWPWLSVAVRPETVRLRFGYDCSIPPCQGVTRSYRRVLVGFELNEKPGAIVSAAFWGLVFLIARASN